MLEIDISVKPSRIYFSAFIVLWVLAFAMVWQLDLPWYAALGCCWIISLYGQYVWQKAITMRHEKSIHKIRFLQKNHWQIQIGSTSQTCHLLRDSYVTRFFMVLLFEAKREKKRYSCVIFPDAISATQYRQLQIHLRFFDFSDQQAADDHLHQLPQK